MNVQMFNGWYFMWLAIMAAMTAGLYFLLRNKTEKTQKIVMFSILVFGLLLHFLKAYIPPYSVDEARHLRDAWFVNICAANIAVFPFLFLLKNKHIKDYMFYIGVISGLIAIFYPQEPMAKVDQAGEVLDIIRFYFHHWMLFVIPMLSVVFKHHKLSYKRIWNAPTGLMILMLFIMLNQLFQSELGFIPLRSDDFFSINYKNSSYIWGPGENDAIGNFLALLTPKFFKTVPVGEFAGQEKYWPWFWLIVPAFVYVCVISFVICMFFDGKTFVSDIKVLKNKVSALLKKGKTEEQNPEQAEEQETTEANENSEVV